ncbi:MAG: T9SS type A sorting domain-containing protein [Sphingobacteriia bacterium]|jgi:hypothetical protein|nr:T9SS type A sorting domain-containing protein [Paludibacteraceae bacterium]NCA79320.1 T9SS type A sorting domain-containing protein [Sphingobacteriia bacterium]
MKTNLLLIACFCHITLLTATTPYISKIFDFVPAPGQFTNILPSYEEGNIKDSVIAKAYRSIAKTDNGTMICLGAWGGYIVVGFDHTIPNVADEKDFKIAGNAFVSYQTDSMRYGGSSEPGIVMVAYDTNKNGLPDDEWYEIAGSEYYKNSTIKDYEVTYYKPTTAQDSAVTAIDKYIRWKDNQGQSGYICKNVLHKQSYYPLWIKSDSITFKGTLLPQNGVPGTNGGNTILYAFDWGYADNFPNTDDRSHFDIEWAVDSTGNPVHLNGIDFIKVYTGVLQNNGFLGECSTEIAGITDLHYQSATTETTNPQLYVNTNIATYLNIFSDKSLHGFLFTAAGIKIGDFAITSGNNILSTNSLPNGLYLLQITDNQIHTNYKLIK